MPRKTINGRGQDLSPKTLDEQEPWRMAFRFHLRGKKIPATSALGVDERTAGIKKTIEISCQKSITRSLVACQFRYALKFGSRKV